MEYIINGELNNLYNEREIMTFLKNLVFGNIKVEKATINMSENYLSIDIIMTNKDIIKYEMTEHIDYKIFHFGDHDDDIFPYTEEVGYSDYTLEKDVGSNGVLKGVVRNYPYYVKRYFQLKLNKKSKKRKENDLWSGSHFIQGGSKTNCTIEHKLGMGSYLYHELNEEYQEQEKEKKDEIKNLKNKIKKLKQLGAS